MFSLFIFMSILRQLYARYMSFLFPTKTRLLKCDPASITFSPTADTPLIADPTTSDALHSAARLLRHQKTVVFPTETVYGLGAHALDTAAASNIFSTKGRPPDNPLIVHVSSLVMLHTLLPPDYAPSLAYRILIKHFWPGALTLLFPRNPDIVPAIITANQPSVAIRMPSHPVARALIAVANVPLAAPSANTSGRPSPTRAEHVLRDLDGKVELILDGGPSGLGLESTVVDGLWEDGNIRVLRPGGVTVEQMEAVIRKEMHGSDHIPSILVHRRDFRDDAIEETPTTPGMKYRHYSPSVPVTLLCTCSKPPINVTPVSSHAFFSTLNSANPSVPIKVGVMAPEDSDLWSHVPTDQHIQWRPYRLGKKADPSTTARLLFDGLLTLDMEGVDMILIEEIAEEREGLAVMNRVRKAAGDSKWIIYNG
ncbi:translation factor [Cyathus striatus]|nr:translation factor [Cyathus striatus]